MARAWPYDGAYVVIEPLQQPIFAAPQPTPFARIITPAPATNAKITIANIVVLETNKNGNCMQVAALACPFHGQARFLYTQTDLLSKTVTKR